MTDLLTELITYLASKGISITYGTNAFTNYEPDAPNDVIVINEYAGKPSLDGMEVARRSLQIICRSTSSETARVKAWSIYNILDTPDDRICEMNTNRVCIFSPKHTPIKMRVDSSNRVVWGFNINVTTIKDK